MGSGKVVFSENGGTTSGVGVAIIGETPYAEGKGDRTDILLGDAKPSGKLPHTWPKSMSQIPINDGDASYEPLYPFGYGLTY